MTPRLHFPKSRSIFASAVVAALVGCLAGLQPASAQSRSQNTRLQPQVNALATQLQLAFRDDPIEYDMRYAQLAAVVTAWNESAKKPADRAALATWFQAAIRASMPGSVEPMPELPALDGRATTIDRLPPPLEWEEPSEAEDQPQPKPAALPALPDKFELPPITPVETPTTRAAEPTTPAAAGESSATPAEKPAAPAEDGGSLLGPVEPPPSKELDFPFGGEEPQPTTPEAATPAEPPAEEPPTTEPPAVEEPAAEAPADEKTSVEEPAEVKLTTDSPPPVEEEPSTEEPPAEDSSAIDLFGDSSEDPFQDDPVSEDAPAEEKQEDEPAEAEEAKETDAAVVDPAVQPASHQPAINLSEFRSRTEGFNRGLRDLESELLENDEPIDDQLAAFSRTLDELLGEYEFLELYFKGLNDSERAEVAAPESADAVLKLLNKRLTAAGKPEFERSEEQGAGN